MSTQRFQQESLKLLRFVNSLSKRSEVKNSKAEMRYFSQTAEF
jgi:hypothetical protein